MLGLAWDWDPPGWWEMGSQENCFAGTGGGGPGNITVLNAAQCH